MLLVWPRGDHTSVGEEAVIMMCLKEAQQDSQGGQYHQDVDADPYEIWHGPVQSPPNHCNARLHLPALQHYVCEHMLPCNSTPGIEPLLVRSV